MFDKAGVKFGVKKVKDVIYADSREELKEIIENCDIDNMDNKDIWYYQEKTDNDTLIENIKEVISEIQLPYKMSGYTFVGKSVIRFEIYKSEDVVIIKNIDELKALLEKIKDEDFVYLEIWYYGAQFTDEDCREKMNEILKSTGYPVSVGWDECIGDMIRFGVTFSDD